MMVGPGALGSNIRSALRGGQPIDRCGGAKRRLTLPNGTSRINIGKSAGCHEISEGRPSATCNKERSVRLLIAIPVYNEQKYVQTVLDKVKRFHDDILI